MRKIEFCGSLFRATYTLNEQGPHPTIPYDYYDDTCAITAIFQGGGVCSVEGTPYPLEPGTMMVLSPEEIRSFRLRQSGCHERLSLYFTGSVVSPVLSDPLRIWKLFSPHSRKCYTPQQYDPAAVTPILERMRNLICGEAPLKEAKLHMLILELLFALYDAGQMQEQEVSAVQNEKIGQICGYIRSHLAEDLRYEALQKRFLVSRYQLTEVFSRSAGMTLTEYILNKRLLKALSLVRSGEGLENAAYQAGFRTYSHFYKEFKKHYKTSPRQYLREKKPDL